MILGLLSWNCKVEDLERLKEAGFRVVGRGFKSEGCFFNSLFLCKDEEVIK